MPLFGCNREYINMRSKVGNNPALCIVRVAVIQKQEAYGWIHYHTPRFRSGCTVKLNAFSAKMLFRHSIFTSKVGDGQFSDD